LAIENGHLELVHDLLFVAKANPNQRRDLSLAMNDSDENDNRKPEEKENRSEHDLNHLGMTPIMLATSLGRIDMFKLLYQAGADIDCLDKDGNSLWMYALFSGTEAMMSFMLKSVVKNSLIRSLWLQRNQDGFTVGMLAAIIGHTRTLRMCRSIVSIYPELSSWIHQKDSWGHRTALQLACQAGQLTSVQSLLESLLEETKGMHSCKTDDIRHDEDSDCPSESNTADFEDSEDELETRISNILQELLEVSRTPIAVDDPLRFYLGLMDEDEEEEEEYEDEDAEDADDKEGYTYDEMDAQNRVRMQNNPMQSGTTRRRKRRSGLKRNNANSRQERWKSIEKGRRYVGAYLNQQFEHVC